MGFKKNYNEHKEIILKIVYAFILPVLTFLMLDLFDYTSNMFGLVFFVSALCYTVPFWITAFRIKNTGAEKLAPIVLTDFICLYAVSLFTSLVCDFINAFRFGMTEYSGVTTLILSLMYLLIFLLSIVLYGYMNRRNKKA